MFGGSAPDATGENGNSYRGNVNALWAYSPSVNEWAWMGGDYATSNCSVQILYPLPVIICDGAQGTAVAQYTDDARNVPASRTLAGAWTDKNGNF